VELLKKGPGSSEDVPHGAEKSFSCDGRTWLLGLQSFTEKKSDSQPDTALSSAGVDPGLRRKTRMCDDRGPTKRAVDVRCTGKDGEVAKWAEKGRDDEKRPGTSEPGSIVGVEDTWSPGFPFNRLHPVESDEGFREESLRHDCLSQARLCSKQAEIWVVYYFIHGC